jgi:osmotically-inducible protein OsmY
MHFLSILALAFPLPAASTAVPETVGASITWTPVQNLDDAAITDRVLAAIGSDEATRYDAASVRVSTRDGIVTLSGLVHRETIRKRMEQIAHAVRGVARVANLITTEPSR